MTADEAGQLIRGQQGRLCARFFRRSDGTIVTQDCAESSQTRLMFGNDGEYRPIGRSARKAGRRLQFGLSTLMLLMIGCATALGVVRVIPPRWIAAAQSWLAPEHALTPFKRPAPNPGYYEDVGMVVEADF